MKLKQLLKSKFTFLSWDLEPLAQRVATTSHWGIIQPKSLKSKYPTRALRYWWVERKLREITSQNPLNQTIKIIDMGCNKGNIKHFVGELPNVEWIGLDWKVNKSQLKEAGYTQSVECDFCQKIPIAENSADVLIFLHVIEHLPNPEFTMQEIARILRPNGLLLAGSPIAPSFVAYFRHKQLRYKLKQDPKRIGRHINSLCCPWWKRLLKANHFECEIFSGVFFMRHSGNPLENHKWWIRLNLLWGALFPAIGGELYIAARNKKQK